MDAVSSTSGPSNNYLNVKVCNFRDLTFGIEKLKKQSQGTVLGIYIPRGEVGEIVFRSLRLIATEVAQLEALDIMFTEEDPDEGQTHENQRKNLNVRVTNYLDLKAAIKKMEDQPIGTVLGIYFTDTVTERVKKLLKRRAADNAFFDIEYLEEDPDISAEKQDSSSPV